MLAKELNGKKLLILGANPETIPLVKTANAMGVKTIVTSNVSNDIAKKYAWKAYDVDGLDVLGLIMLAREENIDGVLVGVADLLVNSYCKVCEALELPCYASQSIVNTFTYKDIFKSTCERFGVHGIPEYFLDVKFTEEDINHIEFPVMVKPVDSYSGLGMTVVYKKEELKTAVDKALKVSFSKRFIIEKYMQCEDVGIYYTFQNGKCLLSCIYDRHTTDKQPGYSRVNLGSIYPSIHISEYYERMHENVVRMFHDIGIQNGVLLISAFYQDGEFYVYDPGFRLQGEAPHLIINSVNGFDQREMLIRFALTGDEGEPELMVKNDPKLRGKSAATFWVLLKAGKIGVIEGLENIDMDHRIIANIQRLKEGDVVEDDWIGSEKQVMTRLYIVCENKQELREALCYYMNKIKVFDVNGNNMVIPWFDPDEI